MYTFASTMTLKMDDIFQFSVCCDTHVWMLLCDNDDVFLL